MVGYSFPIGPHAVSLPFPFDVPAIDPVTVLVGMLALVVVAYATATLFWLFESLLARGAVADPEEFEWGLEDIQARVMTVDNAEVVQATVDALPDAIGDVRVVSEREIDVDGATVHAVPERFDCEATHKGRALEWARRAIPCDQEYVLYLDEDTIVASLQGVPDADVVQFTELPMYTGSRIAYLCEVFRIGFQYEQRAFSRFKYPLYVWGGGIAIRKSLEDRVTWNYSTVTEDTAFVWRAVKEGPFSFSVVDAKFRNQAPSSVRGMFKQRRRWMSGTWAATTLLPWSYRGFVSTRAMIWGLSPLVVLVAALASLIPAGVSGIAYFDVLLVFMLVYLHSVSVVGALIYDFRLPVLAVSVLLTVPLVVLNTTGALWGLIAPVRVFEVTEKASPTDIERAHPAIDDGGISRHDGTGRIGNPSAPFYQNPDTDRGAERVTAGDAADSDSTDVSRSVGQDVDDRAEKEADSDGPQTETRN